METQIIHNSDLHFEHTQWKNELLFWKDEIRSFKNRLNEIVSRWTDIDVLKDLERFENNFTIHSEKIQEFLNKIEAHELNISKHYEKNEDVIDRVLYKQHLEFREKIETERALYTDLKKNFFLFLSRYM